MNSLKFYLCVFVGVAAFLVSPDAKAAAYQFCMNYHVSTTDSGNGEDYYTSPNGYWRARGAHVRVRTVTFPYSTVWDGYASESGCFSFSSSSSQFQIDLYTETKVGPSQNVTFRALPTAASSPQYWTILTSPGLSSGTHWFYGPASDLSNLIAMSTFSYYWFDRFSGDRFTEVRTVDVIHQSCPSISNNSCNYRVASPSQSGRIYIHPDFDQAKFHVAHEVGHQIFGIHFQNSTFPWGIFDCSYNGGGAGCSYSTGASTNEHAIHSKEWASCAASEGFAHFVATDSFNSHFSTGAHFHYYKSGYPAAVNAEGGSYGGVVKFMENECSGVDTDYGVELDWLRAFWDYHTDPGVQLSHADILSQYIDAQNNPNFTSGAVNIYFSFWDAATTAGHGSDWQTVGERNGIDHF